jgi:hypothetical protein
MAGFCRAALAERGGRVNQVVVVQWIRQDGEERLLSSLVPALPEDPDRLMADLPPAMPGQRQERPAVRYVRQVSEPGEDLLQLPAAPLGREHAEQCSRFRQFGLRYRHDGDRRGGCGTASRSCLPKDPCNAS